MPFAKSSKTVHSPRDIPKEDHYAILTFGSIYIPGDERSRTNPGHGYPGGSEPTTTYTSFTDIAEWKAEIEYYVRNNREFVPLVVVIPKVTTEVKVNVG